MASDSRERMLTWVAIGVLAAYALLIVYMLLRTTSLGADQWDRAMYLLTGVEAIVFVAVGYLFGVEVNRKRAENAELRAVDAESRSLNAEGRAANAECEARHAQDELANALRTLNSFGSTALVSEAESAGAGQMQASATIRPVPSGEGG